MPRNIRLDHAGMAELLKRNPAIVAEISKLAHEVESHVAASDVVTRNAMPTEVQMTTTDRAKAYVSILHPGALAAQAKHGVLTQAASAIGLEVKAK